MSSKKKSYFSKNSICEIINEIISNSGSLKKEELALHLLNKDLINKKIYNELTNYTNEQCNALVKNGRCNNPSKENGMCSLHLHNPPDLTWKEYIKVKNKIR
jgi:hypothetical protein